MRVVILCYALLMSVYGADSNTQIYIDSRMGNVYVYLKGRLVKKQNILNQDYRDAVVNNTLDVFWNIPEIKANADKSLPIPIKVAGFKHVNQIGGTCNEASYREWCVYFINEYLAECPALKDVGLFNTAVMRDKFDVSHENTLARARVDRDGRVNYSGTIDRSRNRASGQQISAWLKKYLNIETLYHGHISLFPIVAKLKQGQNLPQGRYSKRKPLPGGSYTYLINQQLLLGNGIVAYCKVDGGGHALNIFGTDGNQVYVSTWGKVYKGDFPEFGQFEFYDHASLLIPRRSEKGNIITNLENNIIGGLNEVIPIQVNSNEINFGLPLVSYNELKKNPQLYKDKEIFLYGSLSEIYREGLRIKYASKDKFTLFDSQENRYRKFKKKLESEFPNIFSTDLHKARNYLLKGTFKYNPQAHPDFALQTYFINCVVLDLIK